MRADADAETADRAEAAAAAVEVAVCSASFSAASRADSTGTTGCMADADAEEASATGNGGGMAAGTRMLREGTDAGIRKRGRVRERRWSIGARPNEMDRPQEKKKQSFHNKTRKKQAIKEKQAIIMSTPNLALPRSSRRLVSTSRRDAFFGAGADDDLHSCISGKGRGSNIGSNACRMK
jgi:hypothetical protein